MNNDPNTNGADNFSSGENQNTGATRKFDTSDIKNAGEEIVAEPPKSITPKVPAKKKDVSKTVKRVLKIALYVLLTFMLIGFVTGIFVGVYYINFVNENFIKPSQNFDIVGLETNLKQTSKIYYTDEFGNKIELEDQRLHGNENRSWVSVYDMPANLKNAFIAIEDERFYEHNGMDLKRTLGAVLGFIGGDSSYGGSTITQQLIKNFTGENDATIQRKITEIFRAMSLTKNRSKDEVLEMYLNTINLSNGCHGVQAAANYLFGKDVEELTLVECASLASIPKSPYKYNPKSHPEENKERRDTVLYKMHELGHINDEEYEEALSAELVLNITSSNKDASGTTEIYSYFTDALIEQLIADFNEQYGYPRSVAVNIIFNGGLEIHSTVDPRIQSIMEEVYEDPTTFNTVNGIQPESAMVVMDPFTGEVKGLVGGRGEKTESRGLNRATMSKRQIGSAIKPLTVYAPAIDLGYVEYSTIIDDTPYKYLEDDEKYWPENAGRAYQGLVTVNYGLAQSLNTTAVKTLDLVTPEYAYYFGKEKLGLKSLVEADIDYAPLALGGLTNGLTVLEVTGAYSIFPNEGVYSAPHLYTVVYDNEGNVLLENEIDQTVAISRSSAQLMTKMMENVVINGTGTKVTLKDKIDVAGKTGSTNSNKDLYFAGYTPYYVGACWFGYDEPKYISNTVFPTNPAMLCWDKVMTKIHEELIIKPAQESGATLKEFADDELVQAEFCGDSGKVATVLCEAFDPRGSRVSEGWYIKGSVPREKCDKHIMVEFCPVSNGVAGENCPTEGRKQFALVNVSNREFYVVDDLYIQDTQYSFRKMPSSVKMSTDPTKPYYFNLVPDEMHTGSTRWVEYPFNRGCAICNPTEQPEKPEEQTKSEDKADKEEPGEERSDDTTDNKEDDSEE